MIEAKPHPHGHREMPFQKESIISLQNFQENEVRVRFLGGREIQGMLKGFDTSLNMVLDGCVEFLRDPSDPYKLTGEQRKLGLVVVKGSMFLSIGLAKGFEEIENPFLQAEAVGE